MIYAARYETMNALLGYLTENCCGGVSLSAAVECKPARETRQNSSLKGNDMKRLHVHVAVNDIPQSIGFYSALFAAQPTVVKSDYAKWMLDDPRVNFAISTRGREPGLDHLGIQVEDAGELNEVYARLRQSGRQYHRAGRNHLLLCQVGEVMDR